MIFPMISPQKAAANTKFADGEYSVPFTVLKDTGSGQSATAEYVVSPAKVIIQNGKVHVVMTLNNSSWWQYFKVNSSDVQVLSDNGDKRVVKFPVQDIEQLVNAKIHIIVTGIPGFEYDNKYDIRFKFNSSNIPLAKVPEKPVTTPPPAPKPSTPEKVETKPTPKPAEKPVEKKQETAPQAEVTKTESKEADADKPEAQQTEKEEETTELVDEKKPEQPEDAVDEEGKDAEADKEEEPEVEEPVVVTDEQAADELKSDNKSNSTLTLMIVIIAIIVAGGAFFFITKKRSRTQK